MSPNQPQAPTLSVEPSASPADLQSVFTGLRAYNVAEIGDPQEQAVNVFLRDGAGTIVGGLVGHIKWKWLYVAKLWVSEPYRGGGSGSRLMASAEAFAREHGATDAYLDTFGY